MAELKRTRNGQFVKGQSGNPKGRTAHNTAQQLRNLLADDIELIVDTLKKQAIAGDTSSAKLLLDRMIPTLKPIQQTTVLDAFSPESVADLMTQGDIAPDEGHKLVATMLAAQQFNQNERLETLLLSLSSRLETLEKRLI